MAWSYLVLTTDGPPLNHIKGIASQNPYEAWNLLLSIYQPKTMDEYARLSNQMEQLKMDDPYEDPEKWISDLLRLNARLKAIKTTYGKEDVQIMSHILSKLPRHLYELFITNYELQGYSSVTLHDFQTKLRDFWSRHVRNKADNIVMTMDHPKFMFEDTKPI